MYDILPLNYSYTWFGPGGKYSHIDRAVVNFKWFTSTRWILEGRGPKTWDHSALLLRTDNTNFGRKPFRFFNAWLQEDGFSSMIIDKWKAQISGSNIHLKFKHIRTTMKSWLSLKESCESKIKRLEDQLTKSDCNSLNFRDMKSIGEDLRSNYDKWESMIKQKSRLNCASQGDANTKFFHNFVKYRQRKNSIHGILVNIIWITSPAQIKVAFYNHFSCFFNLSSIGQAFKLGNLVGSKLTVSQANDLEKDISTS